MIDHWEILDVYKALFAIVAGIILGLERELKDKVAGLKTITIICLGATLFGILSYKVGGTNNPTHIAAYVVSGVGFLGAGAIFKDGFSISGLTTAGIIWLAAAVGLAIGFSEFYLAATFMGGTLLIIFLTPLINRLFRSKKITKLLKVTFIKQNTSYKEKFIDELRSLVKSVEVKKVILSDNIIEVSIEVVINEGKVNRVEQFLIENKSILSFSL